jgi:hypothetical protein
MFFPTVLYYWDLFFFWTLSIALVFFKPLRFKGWFFPRPQVKPTLPIEPNSIEQIQPSKFHHLMTREEPSLETQWFKKT